MAIKILLIAACFVHMNNGDVSHLLQNAYSTYQAALNTINGGYYYDPPLIVPSTPRPVVPTAPLVPEIIVNKKETPKNVYLPPTIIFPATQADEYEPFYPVELPPSPAYLPPAADPLPPQPPKPERPSHAYLPPQQTPIPPLPPQFDEPKEPESDGYHYPVPQSHARLKDADIFGPVKQSSLQLELNDLRCMSGRNGYFRANIIVQSFIENLPIIDTELQDPRCHITLVRTKFVLNLAASDFTRCGVHACGDHELCIKLRFPQIGDMKSIGDAMLTLQCKIQEKTVAKTHSLRFGVNSVK